jgi:hypothetical protein
MTKHGAAKRGGETTEYRIWKAMLARCYNPNVDAFPRYGGRGIFVCDRWRHSFPNFFEDMGPRPGGKSIERIDNDFSYSKENCRWATCAEQNRNQHTNHILNFNGVVRCLVDWGKLMGIPHNTIINRLNRGWSIERALSEKPKPPRMSFSEFNRLKSAAAARTWLERNSTPPPPATAQIHAVEQELALL